MAKASQFLNTINPADHIISLLPKDSLLIQFSEIYLQSISERTQRALNPELLAKFIEKRYQFFRQTLSERSLFRVDHGADHGVENRTVIEMGYCDTPYAILTVENLFKEKKLRVTRKIHLVLGVKYNREGQLTSILKASESVERYLVFYAEIEEMGDPELMEQLQLRLELHAIAVQLSNQHQEPIRQRLLTLKPGILKVKKNLTEPPEEWCHLIDWLHDNNMSFFGAISLVESANNRIEEMQVLPDSGLGILSESYLKLEQSKLLATLKAHSWNEIKNTAPFVFDLVRIQSPVQRFENLMRLSIRLANKEHGEIHYIFVGLLKMTSMQAKDIETPIIRLKMQHCFNAKNMLPGSYAYNELIRNFANTPKFELFRTSASELMRIFDDLQSIINTDQIHCFGQNIPRQHLLKLMIVMPNYLFTDQSIQAILNHLKFQISHSDYEIIEIRGNEKSRLHLYFDLLGDGVWKVDLERMEAELSDLVQPWQEQVRDVLYQQYPGNLGIQLFQRYIPLMPSHYRVRTSPKDAVRDLTYLDSLAHEGGIRTNMVTFSQESYLAGKASLLYVYSIKKIDLIHIMPVLLNMGLYVIDQLTARLGNSDKTCGFVLTFRVQAKDGKRIDEAQYKQLLGDILKEVFNGRTENDPLNGLALAAKLNWRAINVIQLYRNLYLQLGAHFSSSKINQTLLSHPVSSRILFDTFEQKFSIEPSYGSLEYRQEVTLPQQKQRFFDSLEEVDDISDDLILRSLFNLILQTLRTNFYIPKSGSETFISIKLDSKQIENIPVPAPYREIYVHDVGMEGLHLRFGAVARGGLRWSDRLDDFRTEILGLVKTQQIKNVVIVPVGSKGGFIVKNIPTPREEIAAESQKQYRILISALLDITDNVDSNGQVTHPNHVLTYDDKDPYLVVAADKGTATFSDIANSISQKYNFWLGDAFASGGSVGYDHKKEAITARGAWECVKLHFKEMGKDIQTEITTVAGIGDMSGDVFGNGMLLSKTLLLKAAFNHMHIFLDPNPEPQVSWQERKRLFDLPRSTWKDYSSDLISEGGGVFDRKAKEIHLSPQIKEILGVDRDVMNGEEMTRAILCMEINLFWFGGIGTYIKTPSQSQLSVGDQTNNAIRIDYNLCKAKVIGEGANLGLTQLARIEFNSRGGRINTDAIDNSAGVNMSDYEVNIKILLQQMLREGHLKSLEERNQVLAKATNEVSELVLANNRGQHRLISEDTFRSKRHFKVFRNLIAYLVQKGMNARSEFIPESEDLDKLEHFSLPMPRPVIAVLQAYVKMGVYNTLLESKLILDPYLNTLYGEYFPDSILKRFGEHIYNHQLKNEIVATMLTNQIVNQAGCTFYYRIQQFTGKTVEEITCAYIIIFESMRGKQFHQVIDEAEGVREEDKFLALVSFQDVVHVLVQNLLKTATHTLSFQLIEEYRTLLEALISNIQTHYQQTLRSKSAFWQQKNFTQELAERIAAIHLLESAPDVIYLHEKKKIDIPNAWNLAVVIEDIFGFRWLKEQVYMVVLNTDWDLSHQDILLQSIESYKIQMMKYLINTHETSELVQLKGDRLIAPLRKRFPFPLDAYFQTLAQLKTGTPVTLTTLTVSINRLNFIVSI
ncbi:NAD-glutamate dehydrogenase domain-containing protein [Deltaproteobacteria bacterium TL4]